jgi:hypothetical protein
MENLLRGLLEMETAPAVMLVEALAFSNGGMGGGGGRMHLPVAQFYGESESERTDPRRSGDKVRSILLCQFPLIFSQRHPLANHFGRYPELVRPYFAQE